MDEDFVTEVPRALKQLARLVIRGFYSFDHVILIDILIRHPCMKEDDIVELLKFERKQLRAVLASLKSDKFLKVRLRMETGPDGKASRQNYYYINYKVFVNVVKYKLDHMRRKIETEERDSASRASFRCKACSKTFTDLEADQLIDFNTGEFRCTYCNSIVEEDASAVPLQDSRMVLARFNEQIEPLYVLLREVEDVRLAPELLEPEPTDVSHLKTNGKVKQHRPAAHGDNRSWSGEATRNRAYDLTGDNQGVVINFDESGNKDINKEQRDTKELPVWMSSSTIDTAENSLDVPDLNSIVQISTEQDKVKPVVVKSKKDKQPDIMSVLLAHEKKQKTIIPGASQDSDSNSSDFDDDRNIAVSSNNVPTINATNDAQIMESDDEEEDIPMVTVGGKQVSYVDVTPEIIAGMTQSEKDEYIKVGQEMYSNMYE